MSQRPYRGRIAPSPTGYLHLGHAKTFWTAYSRCREANGTLVYRDEDIDLHRCKAKYARAAVEDLRKLGLRWDEGPIRQSDRLNLYRAALETLAQAGHIYPCPYSRKQINESPDVRILSNGECLFPTSLRPPDGSYHPPLNYQTNWRFVVPGNRAIAYEDQKQGRQSYDTQKDFGDFLVWRKEGLPSYELAVVVDDAHMSISEVVRGADLLLSTARQLLIYEALEWKPPKFYHETLVTDDSGARLAKRHDSLALRILFEQGHTQKSIRALWHRTS